MLLRFINFHNFFLALIFVSGFRFLESIDTLNVCHLTSNSILFVGQFTHELNCTSWSIIAKVLLEIIFFYVILVIWNNFFCLSFMSMVMRFFSFAVSMFIIFIIVTIITIAMTVIITMPITASFIFLIMLLLFNNLCRLMQPWPRNNDATLTINNNEELITIVSIIK